MPPPKTATATIKDWADYLEELLERAKSAVEKEDKAGMKAVRDELYEFDEHSPKGATLLDRIANQTAVDLYEAELSKRLDRLKQRDQEYAEVYALIVAAAPPPKPKKDK